MNQADDQSQRIMEQYATLKRRFSISIALVGVPVLVLLIGALAFSASGGSHLLGLPLAWVAYGGVVLVAFIGTALSLKYWRCPACGKYMGGAWFMRHCPRCGEQLAP